MEAIEAKLSSKAFSFIGRIYLIYDMDFLESELEVIEKSGWHKYRRYWHMAPKGWAPTKK